MCSPACRRKLACPFGNRPGFRLPSVSPKSASFDFSSSADFQRQLSAPFLPVLRWSYSVARFCAMILPSPASAQDNPPRLIQWKAGIATTLNWIQIIRGQGVTLCSESQWSLRFGCLTGSLVLFGCRPPPCGSRGSRSLEAADCECDAIPYDLPANGRVLCSMKGGQGKIRTFT